MDIKLLTSDINNFANERDWKQFHNPKDLAAALSIEVSELQEIMLWTSTDKSAARVAEKREAVENEVGDIMVYLLRFCDICGIDPIEATVAKMKINAVRYPIHKAKGNSRKYNEF
jgi:dCTP diphosphatase